LRQIVRTECDHIRRTRRPLAPCDDTIASALPDPIEHAIAQEQASAIRTALQGLNSTNRETARMYYLDEKSCSEVAAILQVPPGTVKRRLYDAREQLRQELKGLLDDPAMQE
jgi:RNA polymerase sigma-70 factor (ECF subfamily)